MIEDDKCRFCERESLIQVFMKEQIEKLQSRLAIYEAALKEISELDGIGSTSGSFLSLNDGWEDRHDRSLAYSNGIRCAASIAKAALEKAGEK